MKKSQKIILAVCLAVSVIAIVAIVCILARRPEPIEDNIGGNVNNSGDLVTSSGDEMYLNVTKKVGDIEISDIKITLIEKNNCRIEAKVKNTGDKFLESTNIEIKAIDGVRYTVPSVVNVDRMDGDSIVRFRVGDVYKNHYVSVYLNDERILHRKKQVMAPGEMANVVLKKDQLAAFDGLNTITVKLEEA